MGQIESVNIRNPTDEEFENDRPHIRTYIRTTNDIGKNRNTVISRACESIRHLFEDENISEYKIVERANAHQISPYNNVFGGRPTEVIREIITKKNYVGEITVTEKFTFRYN